MEKKKKWRRWENLLQPICYMVCTSTNLSTQVSLGQIFHMRHYRTYQASLKRDIPMTNLCDLLPRANKVSSHVEWKQLANVLHDNCRPYACNHKRTAPTQILQCEFQEKCANASMFMSAAKRLWRRPHLRKMSVSEVAEVCSGVIVQSFRTDQCRQKPPPVSASSSLVFIAPGNCRHTFLVAGEYCSYLINDHWRRKLAKKKTYERTAPCCDDGFWGIRPKR